MAAWYPHARGKTPVIAENYYAQQKNFGHRKWGRRFRRVRRAVYDGPHKFIWSSDDRHELYDLAIDAAEAVNLVGKRPAEAARLRGVLEGLAGAQTGDLEQNDEADSPALTPGESGRNSAPWDTWNRDPSVPLPGPVCYTSRNGSACCILGRV